MKTGPGEQIVGNTLDDLINSGEPEGGGDKCYENSGAKHVSLKTQMERLTCSIFPSQPLPSATQYLPNGSTAKVSTGLLCIGQQIDITLADSFISTVGYLIYQHQRLKLTSYSMGVARSLAPYLLISWGLHWTLLYDAEGKIITKRRNYKETVKYKNGNGTFSILVASCSCQLDSSHGPSS